MKVGAAILAIGVALGMGAPVVPARAERTSGSPAARVLGAYDDVRACTPLATGVALATGAGLVVEDAGAVTVLTARDGLPDARVHAVLEAGDGIWIGTEGGAALVRRHGATTQVVRTIAGAAVHALASDGHGLYLGTWGHGVLHLSGSDAEARPVPTASVASRVTALALAGGVLHVAYADGPVARLEADTLRPLPFGPRHGHALATVGGRVFLGDLEGVFRIDAASAPSLASVDARGLAVVGDQLLVATYGTGLLGAKLGSAAFRPEASVPLWGRGVTARGGTACAATSAGAFVRGPEGRWRKVSVPNDLPSNDVTSLGPHGRDVVIGTFDHGAAIARGDETPIPIAGLEASETVHVTSWSGEGDRERLWLGTAQGLVRVDPVRGVAIQRRRAGDGLPSSVVRALLPLADGRLVVGTEEGAVVLDGDRVVPLAEISKRKANALGSPMHATWALAEGPDGTLFVGTSTGLYWGKGGRFERASVASGHLVDDWITALAVRREGVRTSIFAGSYSAGVVRLDLVDRRLLASAPRLIRSSTAARLGGGYVNPNGLTLLGDVLHAATMEGHLERAVDAGAETPWTVERDRSPGRDVTAVTAVNGALWIASRRGIVAFPPAGAAEREKIAP